MENIKNKLISLGKQFLIIILYIFLTVLISLPFAKYLDKSNLCNILISLIILIIFLYIFRKTVIPNFYDFKKNGFKYLKASYTIYLIGLAIMIISNLIISLFMSQAQNETAVESILFALPIYSIIDFIIIGPITEELMMRIILKEHFSKISYILLSGLLFGLLHVVFSLSNNLLELLYIIPYGALGCALASIYYKTDNIWTNITFHALHNTICILILLIGALL